MLQLLVFEGMGNYGVTLEAREQLVGVSSLLLLFRFQESTHVFKAKSLHLLSHLKATKVSIFHVAVSTQHLL